MINPARWCIRNNRTSLVLFLLIALAGALSYRSMSRLEDPEFTVRVAVVVTDFPGATPVKVEQLVTDPLEEGIREISEVKHVTSQSLAGTSIVVVEVFDKFTDMKPIWDRLRDKVEDTAPELSVDRS
jgi:multidrug efflux pump subunit AcrB